MRAEGLKAGDMPECKGRFEDTYVMVTSHHKVQRRGTRIELTTWDWVLP
jgi:hypothetical protein